MDLNLHMSKFCGASSSFRLGKMRARQMRRTKVCVGGEGKWWQDSIMRAAARANVEDFMAGKINEHLIGLVGSEAV